MLVLVLSISAPSIRYKITSGNIGGVFAIHNTTGALYVAKGLDYEKLKKVSVALIITLKLILPIPT